MKDNKVLQTKALFVDWLAIRCGEIGKFCYLQKSVHKLNKLASSDLYGVITLLVEAMRMILYDLEDQAINFFPV